jgi:hypothetical protein
MRAAPRGRPATHSSSHYCRSVLSSCWNFLNTSTAAGLQAAGAPASPAAGRPPVRHVRSSRASRQSPPGRGVEVGSGSRQLGRPLPTRERAHGQMMSVLLAALLLLGGSSSSATASPPPKPRPMPLASGPSTSGLWPRQDVAEGRGETALHLSDSFRVRYSSSTQAPRLQRACARYEGIIRGQKTLWSRSVAPARTLPLPALDVMATAAAEAAGVDFDAVPQLGDDESFELWVNASAATLQAASFSGMHRGLEAFSQLTIRLGEAIIINSTMTHVAGKPAFRYRGFMLDTGRHFEPVPAILQLLDGMAASGLNVLHWHLTCAPPLRPPHARGKRLHPRPRRLMCSRCLVCAP